MANYQEARVKLRNTQLKKLKSAAKNITGTILRINKKNFEDEELPHELFYCITFIESMLAGKTFLDYTNYFALNDYKKNGKIIYKYFKDKYVKS